MNTGSATTAVKGSPLCATDVLIPVESITRTCVPGTTFWFAWALTLGLANSAKSAAAPTIVKRFIESSSILGLCPETEHALRKKSNLGKSNPARIFISIQFAGGCEQAVRNAPEQCSETPPVRGGCRWRSGESAEDAPGRYDTSRR